MPPSGSPDEWRGRRPDANLRLRRRPGRSATQSTCQVAPFRNNTVDCGHQFDCRSADSAIQNLEIIPVTCKVVRSIAACFILALCSATLAQDLSDPKKVLEKSREALKATKVVAYDATIEATEWVKQAVPNVTGKAVVGELMQYEIPQFYCDVQIKRADAAEAVAFQGGCNGDKYFLIDPKTKKAYEDMDPVVMGSNGRDLQRLALREFYDKEPFKAELEAEKAELRETTDVGGESCYQVYVALKGSPKAIAWDISKKDHLPRRVTRWYAPREGEGPDGTSQMTITKLQIDPKFPKDPFVLRVPEGYTKSDEFAP